MFPLSPDKEGREVDFALAEYGSVAALVESKVSDATVSPFLLSVAGRFPGAEAVQIVRDLRQAQQHGDVGVEKAARWLAGLAA